MSDFSLAVIHQRLLEVGLGRSSKTWCAWKRTVGIPYFAQSCNRMEAELLVAAALFRAQFPTATMTKLGLIKFLSSNRQLVAERLSGVPRLRPQLDMGKGYSIDEARAFVRDCSECGQYPSVSTIRRWCVELGINFSETQPIQASTIHRLIDHADDMARARVQRGRQLGQKRRMKAA